MNDLSCLGRRRRSAALAAIALLSFAGMAGPRQASAAAVYCMNCATEWQQAQQYAKEIETALNTARQLQTQMQQYQDMVRQGLPLGNSLFSSLAGDIQRMRGVYDTGKTVSYSMGDLDARFNQQFPGYDSYLRDAGQGESNVPGRYRKWSESGFDNARAALDAVGMNTRSFATEDAMLSELVQRSASAQGRMQAIQAGNEISAQQVQQLQRLREMIAASVTLQSNYIAQETERRAVDDAAREHFHGTVRSTDRDKGF